MHYVFHRIHALRVKVTIWRKCEEKASSPQWEMMLYRPDAPFYSIGNSNAVGLHCKWSGHSQSAINGSTINQVKTAVLVRKQHNHSGTSCHSSEWGHKKIIRSTSVCRKCWHRGFPVCLHLLKRKRRCHFHKIRRGFII